jgi:hypothetical protein
MTAVAPLEIRTEYNETYYSSVFVASVLIIRYVVKRTSLRGACSLHRVRTTAKRSGACRDAASNAVRMPCAAEHNVCGTNKMNKYVYSFGQRLSGVNKHM